MKQSKIETLYRAAVRGRNAMSDELLKVTAQRDLLLDALKQSLEEAIYPSKLLSNVYEKSCAAVKAVEENI